MDLKEVLTAINFRKTPTGYDFDFGNCILQVVESLNIRFQPILYFSGIFNDTRSPAFIEFEIPLVVESLEMGVALISFNLKSFEFELKPNWLKTGLALEATLPWKKKQLEYKNKPSLFIESDWFKLIVKKLRIIVNEVAPEELTTFSFDGMALKVEVGPNVIICKAWGAAWPSSYKVKTKFLDFLPKKIIKKDVNISVWEEHLIIGNSQFPLHQ